MKKIYQLRVAISMYGLCALLSMHGAASKKGPSLIKWCTVFGSKLSSVVDTNGNPISDGEPMVKWLQDDGLWVKIDPKKTSAKLTTASDRAHFSGTVSFHVKSKILNRVNTVVDLHHALFSSFELEQCTVVPAVLYAAILADLYPLTAQEVLDVVEQSGVYEKKPCPLGYNWWNSTKKFVQDALKTQTQLKRRRITQSVQASDAISSSSNSSSKIIKSPLESPFLICPIDIDKLDPLSSPEDTGRGAVITGQSLFEQLEVSFEKHIDLGDFVCVVSNRRDVTCDTRKRKRECEGEQDITIYLAETLEVFDKESAPYF